MRRGLVAALLCLLPAAGDGQSIAYYPMNGGRVLYGISMQTLTTTGTSEQTLATVTLPAGFWTGNHAVRVMACGTHAANTNAAALRLRLGASGAGGAGTSVANMSSSTSGDVVCVGVECYASSSTSAICSGLQQRSASSALVLAAVAGLTLSAATEVIVMGTSGTQAGDITLNSFVATAYAK